MDSRFSFDAPIWVYPGPAAWHFVTLPSDIAQHVRELRVGPPTAFGSVKVRASSGGVTWATSLFPDKSHNSYVLPIKRDVRQRLEKHEGDSLPITLELV